MDCTASPPANLHMTWDLPDRILFCICPLEVRNSSPFPLQIACLCGMADSVSHPPSSANGQQEGESSELDTYLKLKNECRAIAPRVYSKHREMFRDLPSVYALDIEFQSAPLGVQIKAMRDQLDMLKSLDDAPLFGPGLHQMDGDIGESSLDPSRGLALHQPAAAHPPPGAVHRHKLVIKEFRQSKGHIHIRAVVNEVVRNAQ